MLCISKVFLVKSPYVGTLFSLRSMFMCEESMWHLFFTLALLSGIVLVASAFFSCY